MVERSKVGDERPRKLLEIEVFMSKDLRGCSASCASACGGAQYRKMRKGGVKWAKG
jgi:hypothetical protein